jgi:hypothetical protein
MGGGDDWLSLGAAAHLRWRVGALPRCCFAWCVRLLHGSSRSAAEVCRLATVPFVLSSTRTRRGLVRPTAVRRPNSGRRHAEAWRRSVRAQPAVWPLVLDGRGARLAAWGWRERLPLFALAAPLGLVGVYLRLLGVVTPRGRSGALLESVGRDPPPPPDYDEALPLGPAQRCAPALAGDAGSSGRSSRDGAARLVPAGRVPAQLPDRRWAGLLSTYTDQSCRRSTIVPCRGGASAPGPARARRGTCLEPHRRTHLVSPRYRLRGSGWSRPVLPGLPSSSSARHPTALAVLASMWCGLGAVSSAVGSNVRRRRRLARLPFAVPCPVHGERRIALNVTAACSPAPAPLTCPPCRAVMGPLAARKTPPFCPRSYPDRLCSGYVQPGRGP